MGGAMKRRDGRYKKATYTTAPRMPPWRRSDKCIGRIYFSVDSLLRREREETRSASTQGSAQIVTAAPVAIN